MPELMLLSNSFSPGLGALEHAMDALAASFAGTRQVLFIPYAASDPDGYAEAMREVLGLLGVQVAGGTGPRARWRPWPRPTRCSSAGATLSACCGRRGQRAAGRDRPPGPRRDALPRGQRGGEPGLPDHPHHQRHADRAASLAVRPGTGPFPGQPALPGRRPAAGGPRPAAGRVPGRKRRSRARPVRGLLAARVRARATWAAPPAAASSPAGTLPATSSPAMTSPPSSARAPATTHQHAS